MKKSLFENNSLTYREENGRLYPNLELPEQTNYNIGKYGLLHLDFIKEHRKRQIYHHHYGMSIE